jgi:hypothetical protein
MEASEIIRGFCEKLDIAALPEDGVWSFEFDSMPVTMFALEQIRAIAVQGDLGEPPPERLEQLYKLMLEGQHLFKNTGGATLSLDPLHGHFFLTLALPEALVDVDSFTASVEHFISTLEVWRKIIVNFRASSHRSENEDVTLFGSDVLRV